MNSEREVMFEVSEKMLVGGVLARRESRKRDDTGSRRKSGRAAFGLLGAVVCACDETLSLACVVDVVVDDFA
jgi:hypothetical protein